MIGRTWRNGFALASLASAVLTFTALPALASPQDPSQQSTGDAVADAARKAREQKKKDTSKPKRVYTDEDVNHSTLGSTPTATDTNASSTPDGGAAKNSDTQGKDAAGHQEQHGNGPGQPQQDRSQHSKPSSSLRCGMQLRVSTTCPHILAR